MYITSLTDASSGTYYFKDEVVTSSSGTPYFYGRVKVGTTAGFVTSASLTSIGEVFYNFGTLVFRGSDVVKGSLSSFVNSTSATFVNGSGTGMGRINIQSLDFRRREEKVKKIYFCRAYNSSFNYSTNPQFRNTDGTIKDFILDLGTMVFVSGIGLYDDSGDLLAVAKINPVEKKDSETELIFKIAIQY
jgi:hypothetical protein